MIPIISIILPNYNYARYLPHRIESILNQTFTDFELIILDDCSTDNSREVIEKYKNKDSRISVYYNKQNSGNPFKQWQKGIDLAQGKYIWIAEADDYCENTLLEKLYNKISQTNSDIVFSQSNIADENRKILGKWSDLKIKNNSIFNSDFEYSGHKFIEDYLIFENVIPNASAVLFNKAKYYEVGGVDISIKNNSDWFLWLKLLYKANVSFIAKPLNYFRRHPQSVIASTKQKLDKQNEFHEFFSLSMRENYKKWLPKNKKNKQISRINNFYILQDLKRKIKWIKQQKGFIYGLIFYLKYFSIKNLSLIKALIR